MLLLHSNFRFEILAYFEPLFSLLVPTLTFTIQNLSFFCLWKYEKTLSKIAHIWPQFFSVFPTSPNHIFCPIKLDTARLRNGNSSENFTPRGIEESRNSNLPFLGDRGRQNPFLGVLGEFRGALKLTAKYYYTLHDHNVMSSLMAKNLLLILFLLPNNSKLSNIEFK